MPDTKPILITIDTEESGKIEYSIITAFDLNNLKFIALQKTDGSNEIDLYYYTETKTGISISIIDNESDYRSAAEYFEKLLTV